MIDYTRLLSQKVMDLKPSGIRKFFDIANEMEDVISLSIGEPDFATPWHIRQKGIDSLNAGKTWYSPNGGFMELRQEVARYYNRKYAVPYQPEEVVVTVGGSEAIDLCIRALVEPGDEVLIPEPSFVCYDPITRMAGGTPVPIETKAEDSFRLTPEALRAHITDKTKLLILPFPNNPTGGVMRREHLEAIAKVLEGTNVLVLSDEIYSELTYGEPHISFAFLPNMQERTVVVNGFSKSYAMTGWRLGYAMGPRAIIDMMIKIHQYAIMCSPTTSQMAAVYALRNGDKDVAHMREQYDLRRRLLVDGFCKIGLDCFEPEGAFYVFPCIRSTGLTSEEFCQQLLKEFRVAVVPGNAFGQSGEGFVRVSYSYSVNHLIEALDRIKLFVEKQKK